MASSRRSSSARTTLPDDMPSTRFGKPTRDANGQLDYRKLDWASIAQLEAHKAVDWIKFFYRHDRKELMLIVWCVLQTFVPTGRPIAVFYPRWTIYA